MCCLKYEEETYKEINEKLPDVGQEVMTPAVKALYYPLMFFVNS